MAAPGRQQPISKSGLLAGDKRALARAISLVENDDPGGLGAGPRGLSEDRQGAVVGFTGPPGVGKSTLIGSLVKNARARDREVAVLSIDPSSPFTHGALLGDRIRLTDHFLDPGVFIRSMASRGSLGGLSEATLQAALLMDAAGKDDVFLETVGVGQAEVDIIDHADTVVLVLMPGSGDSIQALKAGVMEIPDMIVVNKADHPLTDTMVREIRGVLRSGRGRAGACRSSRPRPRAARAWTSWRSGSRSTASTSRGGHARGAPPAQPENEVMALATVRLRRKLEESCARTSRCRSCSTRSWPAGSTRRAPPPSCSSASSTERG